MGRGSSGASSGGGGANVVTTRNGQRMDMTSLFRGLPDAPREEEAFDEFPSLTGSRAEIRQAERLREQYSDAVMDRVGNSWADGAIFEGKNGMQEYIKNTATRRANAGYDLAASARAAAEEVTLDVNAFRSFNKTVSHTQSSWWIERKSKISQMAKETRPNAKYRSV